MFRLDGKSSFAKWFLLAALLLLATIAFFELPRRWRVSSVQRLQSNGIELLPIPEEFPYKLSAYERNVRAMGFMPWRNYPGVVVEGKKSPRGTDSLANSLAELEHFHEITALGVNDCADFHGEAVRKACALERIQLLSLCRCGNISDSDLGMLAEKFGQIKELHLCKLPQIASFSDVPPSLYRHCQIIHIDGMRLESDAASALLANRALKRLWLADLTVGEVRDDSVLPNKLEWLTLDGVENFGQLLELSSSSPTLTRLRLRTCRLGDRELVALSKLGNLTHLEIANSPIGDKLWIHLGELKKLRYLELTNISTSGAGIDVLAGLPKLERLTLKGNEYSKAQTGELIRIAGNSNWSSLVAPDNFAEGDRVALQSKLHKSLDLEVKGISTWLNPLRLDGPPGSTWSAVPSR